MRLPMQKKNRFVMVHFNGERIKLYDNSKLTIVDAALQAGFPNENLFPKRGRELNFTLNGNPRIARGEAGEAAVVKVNDKLTNINAPLTANSYITIEPSTAGKAAAVTIADVAGDVDETVSFAVNGQNISCPKYVEANGKIVVSSYRIREGDKIEVKNYYTVAQLAKFMDVQLDRNHTILVNNRPADMDTLVYENFTVEWTTKTAEPVETIEEVFEEEKKNRYARAKETTPKRMTEEKSPKRETRRLLPKEEPKKETEENPDDLEPAVNVIVNGDRVRMTGKPNYIFVDVFDFIDFDLKASRGRAIVIKVNGEYSDYVKPVNEGDVIEIYWEEK